VQRGYLGKHLFLPLIVLERSLVGLLRLVVDMGLLAGR
jgi:hypothetical protein